MDYTKIDTVYPDVSHQEVFVHGLGLVVALLVYLDIKFLCISTGDLIQLYQICRIGHVSQDHTNKVALDIF